MPSCAFADCGRLDCPVCKWGRVKVQGRSASTSEVMRENARAELKPARKVLPLYMPKRRRREGPHR